MKRKPTCFISYCRDGVDRNSVNFLVQQLSDASGGKIDFLFDEYLKVGNDLTAFMNLIKVCDGIIILMTPQYKRKVEERTGGVYTEFSAIMERYQRELDAANRKVGNRVASSPPIQSPFCLVPIIFSSNFQNSCPNEISGKLAEDFSEYRAHQRKNGSLYVTGETDRRYKKSITKIVSEISAHYVESTDEFKLSFEDTLDTFFKTTKHEYIQDNPQLSKLLVNTFVKTHAFKRVSTQTSYLLIGRKGSGKSTIAHRLATSSEKKYKKHIDINVNRFELEYIYAFINNPKNKDEREVTVNQINTFEIAWETFIYICCMDAVIAEYQAKKLSSRQSRHVPVLIDLLCTITGSNILETDLNYKALYRWCYAKLFEIKDSVIENARDGLAEFSYDISVKLDHERLVEKIVGTEAIQAFEGILRNCKRRFLVSMDGFDTAFDEFRMGARFIPSQREELSGRVRFEIDWLRGFLHVIQRMKSSHVNVPLASLIDFCAMVPKDRFLEIRRCERDAYTYIAKYHDIRWSGIELAIMLRKRLELLGDFESESASRPHAQLKRVLEEKFPFIPLDNTTTVAGRDYVLPLFISVLRHTFWRPREILIYFAKIISVVKDFRKRDMEINNFTISKCISDTTREIISTEFINEYQRHCMNITDVLAAFRGAKQILSMSELKSLVEDCHPVFIDREDPVYEFNEKLEFLYEIGFLGLRASAELINRLKLLNSDIFWFTTDDEPISTLKVENYSNCKFIIHPIFCEYLDLDTSNQDLTLKFGWDYLEEQEAHMMI